MDQRERIQRPNQKWWSFLMATLLKTGARSEEIYLFLQVFTAKRGCRDFTRQIGASNNWHNWNCCTFSTEDLTNTAKLFDGITGKSDHNRHTHVEKCSCQRFPGTPTAGDIVFQKQYFDTDAYWFNQQQDLESRETSPSSCLTKVGTNKNEEKIEMLLIVSRTNYHFVSQPSDLKVNSAVH